MADPSVPTPQAGSSGGPVMPSGSRRPVAVDLSVIGTTGLKRFAGRVYEEFLPELAGDRWRKVVREMSEQDPMVVACLFAIDQLIRQVDWDVQPADDSPEAQAIAAFYREVLFDDMSVPWAETLSEILSMVAYGWSWFEICYKVRGGPTGDDSSRKSRFSDGRIGWRKLAFRSQDSLLRWEFDEEGGIQGMWQQAPPTYEALLIPIEKSLLFRTKLRKNNPEGVSALRGAYRPWYFKKHVENIEAIGIERDLAGMPIAYIPAALLSADATPEEKAVAAGYKDLVGRIRRDEHDGLVLPMEFDEAGNPLYKIELLTTGGSRQFDTNAVLQRKNQEIAMTLMADFLLLGHENVGSRALSSSKTEIFSDAIGAWLDGVSSVVNNHGFTRLAELNGFPMDLVPKLVHGDLESTDLAEMGAFLADLAKSGAPLFPNDDLMRYLFEQAGLPVPEEDAEEPDIASTAGAPAWSPSAVPVDPDAPAPAATTPAGAGSPTGGPPAKAPKAAFGAHGDDPLSGPGTL